MRESPRVLAMGVWSQEVRLVRDAVQDRADWAQMLWGLAADGLVRPKRERGMMVYRLTEKGQEAAVDALVAARRPTL